MKSQALVNPNKRSVVQLSKGEHWVRLALWLADEFTGGDLVRISHEATVSVEGTDTISASYTEGNWVSGISSGALYAFRALKVPRQRVVLTELAGRLQSSDMEAVANGAAIAISKLAEMELPTLCLEGWTIQAQVAERSTANSSPASQEKPVSSSPAQRRDALRELTSQELVALVTHPASELSKTEIELIHEIASERLSREVTQTTSVNQELATLTENRVDGSKHSNHNIPAGSGTSDKTLNVDSPSKGDSTV